MDAATTSPYWNSYRASRTYRLTIHFFEAQLQVAENSKANPQGAMLDPYVVVFLTRDREGSKQKTSVQKKSLSPVWNQSLVFNELNYSDKLRVEIKANRQFQVNDFLCGFDFIVADVMAQSVQECQPSYRLVGEKVTGTLLAAFDFDPPVPLDIEPPPAAPIEATSAGEEEVEEKVYLNVERNFSCMLIDA
uniref:C2 domain-containing protein n=1 Tax=Florenciella parvula TaxID=236787 RepID=A0A7S2BYM4_9STRA|mmetsp:Transcript_22293/g.46390  ORF Transcript_22293/g.46390 Transcript_22293/m.46390 type:complete len:191 (+) Transcript_22293:85-657(+)|eukprot:CAMPEP_0119470126 /NCGR_PEP_ID=MMETSP1344-20130328/3161_1 /TAXON_ID=236787 /ORGANISM="Florenciella parvula, Strain CCMP2471" /LENGTH=190 /DNA_ID=CAMNT_0007502763 /DNA_START=169 /DNA_END=741 /DNA_ORIENTATION=-